MKSKDWVWLLALVGAWTMYWAFFYLHVFTFKDGQVFIGHITAYGDWAMHLTWMSTFSFRTFFPSVHPLLITALPAYPFVINALSAVLFKLGMNYWVAFLFPVFLASTVVLPLLLFFYFQLVKSLKVSLLATALFFFNGGTGLWQWLLDKSSQAKVLPTSFTIQEGAGYVWGNVIHTQLIPQRALLIGLVVSLVILSLLAKLFIQEKYFLKTWQNYLGLCISSFLFIFLPVIHTHSFIAVSLIILVWLAGIFWQKVIEHERVPSFKFFLKEFSLPVVWVSVSFLGALAIFTRFIGWHHDTNFLMWFPGWYTHTTGQNWVAFWWQNWTFLPLLSLFGLWIAYKKDKQLGIALLPGFLLFLFVNLFLLQPYAFDNTKLLTYASLFMSLAAAVSFRVLWNTRAGAYWLLKVVSTTLFVFIVGSGFADQALIVRQLHIPFLYYTIEELRLATWVRETTSPSSIFIAGDRHNSWVYNLTGRQVVMGYEGWLWTYGFEYQEVKSDVAKIYEGGKSMEGISQYGIDYVVIGPDEKSRYSINLITLSEVSDVVYQTPNWTILKIRSGR